MTQDEQSGREILENVVSGGRRQGKLLAET
jgi:hypothetical protein